MLVTLTGGVTLGQQIESPEPSAHPLSTKQEMVRDRVWRLQDQMYRLSEKLAEAEPQQTRRLQDALRRMGELGLAEQAEAIIALLRSDAGFPEAIDHQAELMHDLRALLSQLLDERRDEKAVKEKIEFLKKALARLGQITREQKKLHGQSQGLLKTMAEVPRDAESAAAIQDLIEKQQALAQETLDIKQGKQGRPADELAKNQRELADGAEKLSQALNEKEAEAAESLKVARDSMSDASQEITAGNHGLASDMQLDAIEDLKQALAQLAHKDGAEPSSTDPQDLAREQKRLEQETEKLAEDLGKPPFDSPSDPAPGQPNCQQASSHMRQSSQNLEQARPGPACNRQQKALSELEQARQQMQQKLNELKQQLQEQKLADLKQTFEKMLAAQLDINEATVELHGLSKGVWRRADQLRVLEQVQAQQELAADADRAFTVIREDATTFVLPQLAEHVRDDMREAAALLDRGEVGDSTQVLQAEIVVTLEDILSALQDSQEPPPTPPAGLAQNQQNILQFDKPPLLPTSTELKLLKDLQKRVFRQTKTYERGKNSNPEVVRRIARKQKDIATMTRKMNEQFQELLKRQKR